LEFDSSILFQVGEFCEHVETDLSGLADELQELTGRFGDQERRGGMALTLSGVERAKTICWIEVVDRLHDVSAVYVVRVAQAAAKSAVLCGKQSC
jgi:hypothetical protein